MPAEDEKTGYRKFYVLVQCAGAFLLGIYGRRTAVIQEVKYGDRKEAEAG